MNMIDYNSGTDTEITNTDVVTDTTTDNSNAFCADDQMCQTIDEYQSTPSNIVYACPSGKCISGQCSCGAGCVRDPRGYCCQGLQTINGESFCVTNTAKPNIVTKPPQKLLKSSWDPYGIYFQNKTK